MTIIQKKERSRGKAFIGLAGILFLFPFTLFAARYKASKDSRIECSVDASAHKARLTGITANIDYDPSTRKLNSFDMHAVVTTLSGSDASWNELLRSPAGFSTQKFPEIEFHADSVKQDGSGIVYRIFGTWQIRGKSARATMQLTALPFADGFIFRGTSALRLADYGMSSTISKQGVMDLFIELKSVAVH
jgi:polyisoprenoid-binding protein YceI